MKKKKRCTRVGAGALAAVLAVTAAGVSVPALAQQAVRTESQTQMSGICEQLQFYCTAFPEFQQ